MISVILVNYKVADLLVNAIRSIYDSDNDDQTEIIVIDNHSEDDSESLVQDRFPDAIWIQNSENLGFACAVNQGIRIARGDVIVLVNPDSILDRQCLSELSRCIHSDHEIGIAGGKVMNPDGSLQKQCRRNIPTLRSAFFRLTGISTILPSLKASREYEIDSSDQEKPGIVQAVSGSLMAFSSSLIDRIGHFDEAFFLFGEDLDFCLRAHSAGFRVVYCPSAIAIHHRGASRKKRPFRTLWHTHHAMAYFYRKHFLKTHPWFVRIIVRIGIWCRWSVLLMVECFRLIRDRLLR